MGTRSSIQGITLGWVLAIIAAIIILGTLAYCTMQGATGVYVTSVVQVSGPASIPRRGKGTFNLFVESRTAATTAVSFTVEIWEDDYFGNVKLINAVPVTVQANHIRGVTTFVLDCNENGDLVGKDGTANADNEFHVFGRINNQPGVTDETGANFVTTCTEE